MEKLDDLDFADNLAFLSHTHEQMQIKIVSVASASASVGLNIHKEKNKVLKYNTENSNPITLDGETLKDVEFFTYLGSIIDEQGGSDADVKAKIDKARIAFLQLMNIWNLKQMTASQYQSENFQYQRQDSQFFCMELERGELQQPSSTGYNYLQTIFYVRYSILVGRIPSATAYCGRKQTRFQLRRKSGKDVGSG
ncbi:unnamed protein product [Schistosoma margrebowiei]|uniref:Uncharacterized protein n=1 Tax=Schistosoma margrebowiei TaxID=48269 RepID=A0A183M785_9TREM|nr:unnamed protein product [Schistosoma margrebowiei]